MLRPLGTTAAIVIATGACSSHPTTAQQGSDLVTTLTERVESRRDALIALRRDLHRHPETSGQERRTAGVVADRLRDLGFSVRTGVGGHGVVGVLAGDPAGPTIAFRADMDAVRSNAPDPVEFRSETPGVRHICGHDVHTTVGLALAEGFAAVRDELPGTIMLVFQPAEENATGARAMLADGVFDDRQPDAIYAYHTAPYPVGQIATASETLMIGRDRVTITASGSGDVAGAAAAAADVVRGVSTVSSPTQSTPPDGVFANVGQPRATGPDRYTVNATVNVATSRARVRRQIEDGVAALRFDGVDFAVEYQEKFVAGVTNDPALAERARTAAVRVLGEDAVLTVQNVIPAFSEDFGSFQDEVPGVMFFLGVSNPERGWVGMPHSPGYVADEEAIFVGARAMAEVMVGALGGGR